MSKIYYSKKEEALKVGSGLLCNRNYTKYFWEENYKSFMETIKTSNKKDFYEYISKTQQVNIFIDIDITEDLDNYTKILDEVKNSLERKFIKYQKKYIILQSHGESEGKLKKSYHIILRMLDENGNNVYFKNVETLRKELSDISNIDMSVYREGLFRTLYSSKNGENRPLIIDPKSDIFEEIESFVGYTVEPKINKEVKKIDNKIEDKVENKSLSENQIKEIVNGLDAKRADDRESWLRVGYFLCKYSFGENLFKEFSKKSLKYDSFRQDYDWKSFKNGESKIDIGTLLMWLKEDKRVLFDKIIKDTKLLNELNELTGNYNIKHTEIVKRSTNSIEAMSEINKALEPLHNMLSKKCDKSDLFGFCCSSGYKLCCRNCNFRYPDRWIEIDKNNAPTIYNTLIIINNNENINNRDTYQVSLKIKEYSKDRLIYTEDSIWYIYNDNNGIYEKKLEIEILNEIENIVEELKKTGENAEWYEWFNKISYKDNVLRELRSKCFKRVKFDSNDYILGFENGVLDLQISEFRKGKEDEYVSMKCGIKYDPNCDMILAQEVINGIYPVKEERDYAINILSLCLEGINREQKITFNYGYTASNGKSYIMERMKEIMGEYGDTFPVNLLTSKMKSSGEANSTLVSFKNKRFMYCSEPETGSKLNTNFVKLLTGDMIKARGLYKEDEILIRPTYKIFANCNTLPNFDTYDEGIARRFRLIEYKTRFVENPRTKNEKKLKKYSREQDLLISQGLLRILVERYKILRENNYIYEEPDTLTKMKKMYINDNKDLITNTLIEHYELGDGYVKMNDIKSILKDHNIKEKDVITIKKIIEDLFPGSEYVHDSSIGGTRIRRVFSGIKEI